jgi:hypothetical protein
MLNATTRERARMISVRGDWVSGGLQPLGRVSRISRVVCGSEVFVEADGEGVTDGSLGDCEVDGVGADSRSVPSLQLCREMSDTVQRESRWGTHRAHSGAVKRV